MDEQAVRDVAERLLEAYRTEKPIAPVIEQHPGATIADAYRIQQHQVASWVADGAVIKGHKVGLTSMAVRAQMNVDEPDYGHLTDRMFHLEHQPIPFAGFLQPRAEPEIAFVLSRKLAGPGVTAAEAIRAVDFVLPAIEIVDSRIEDWRISIVDTIADNASSGRVVLGSSPTRLSDVDLRAVGCELYRNGALTGSGTGAAVLGSPLNSLVWLANTVGPLGVELEPGQVILPGSITAVVPINPGDTFRATFAGLGDVTAIFGS